MPRPYDGMLFSHKKERSADPHCSLDEPGGHAEGQKPVPKGQVPSAVRSRSHRSPELVKLDREQVSGANLHGLHGGGGAAETRRGRGHLTASSSSSSSRTPHVRLCPHDMCIPGSFSFEARGLKRVSDQGREVARAPSSEHRNKCICLVEMLFLSF